MAQGRRNRAIAEAMYVSERAVERHVRPSSRSSGYRPRR
ncbi:MAG TPA: hypothetical protein VN213_20955 [Solirubrobacteraceae bacterium]|nr:hypothetical protein [Solirubrobacteraceae bacterium]